jgi:hypothetical protein
MDITDAPHAGSSPTARFLRTHRTTAILSVLLIAALAYGVSVGVANADWADEAASLESNLAATTADLTSTEQQLVLSEAHADTANEELDAARESQSTLEQREKELDARAEELDTREAAVQEVEDKVAASQITEGTWTVGVDVEAGTYRTSDAVSGDCYWAILRSGSNGSGIVANDIVSGGYPTVTLVDDQDFETSRCGTWNKQ